MTSLTTEVFLLSDAIEAGHLQVKGATEADLRILNKVLVGIWDE
jgi:hypothetical protein